VLGGRFTVAAVKVGILQLNATVGAFAANLEKLRAAYERACGLGAEFVVAPELFLCGYPPRDLLLRRDFVEQNLAALRDAAAFARQVPLCVGFVDWNNERPGKPLRNSAAVVHRGRILHSFSKTLLPTYDVFDEDRYFEPSQSAPPFDFGGRRLALTICEDIWNDEDFWPERLYRRDPVKELVNQGADCIVNLSASPWHRGKEATRLKMLQKVARDERLPLVQVNTVGANDELIFDGHSVALDREGKTIYLGQAFEEEVRVISLEDSSSGEPPARDPEEFLFHALALGIGDYVRKCGFKQVLLGLSGGIDSAVTAVLAVESLGRENVMGVAMPSRFSSQGSLKDAEALARNLGIRYEVLSIESPFSAVEQQLSPVFHDLPRNEAEENVQSRLRGVTLMALSNKFGALVLTTGNKSELSVGYCTLYGDMCGALAPIADVFKTEIYALSKWINRDREIIPWDSITKPPSAELRPDQTDQDSLPPYDVLDRILDAYVVQNMSRDEIVGLGFASELVRDIINKVTFSEYKRRQAAPGLKVSPRAFGMGRRIPIAQRFRA
jgi:NAD+ synthase (glutamine-hydrolysing)